MNKSLHTVWVFAKLNTRRFFRDKVAIFFGIAFPLIILLVLGGIFGRGGGDTSFKVALINESSQPVAKEFAGQISHAGVFKVDADIKSLDAARDKMSRGQLDAAIVLPKDFGAKQAQLPSGEAKVYYSQNSDQAGQTVVSVLQEMAKGLNAHYVKTVEPFKASGQRLTDKTLSAFDYTFAGLLGFAIIGMGIFGPVNVFPELKKQGILRRYSTTPLRVWQYFVANALSQTVVGLVSITIMFLTALVVFHLKVTGNYLEIALFIIFSIIMILGIGLSLGGWAKNERQAAPLSNIVVFPMMFLSGTFFPRFLMPEWLQNVSAVLPLTPVIEGIRQLTTEGKHLIDLGPQLGLMAIWVLVIYAIAFRVFRWE